jgi:Pregnancy-associated plasma protein-A
MQDSPQLDGSTILFDTLPGGSQYGMNLGMTLVHEAGKGLLSPLPPVDQPCQVSLHVPCITSRYHEGGTLSYANIRCRFVCTGHWLGLLHTFDGGCNVADGGDKIGDTPYSAEVGSAHWHPRLWAYA